MALPVTIPNTFSNATTSIPLSQLDTNFSTLANAVNGINSGSEILANLKSSNVTITGGVISNVTLDNVTVDVETLSNVTINGGNVTVTNMVATTANATTGNITTVIVGAGTSAAPSITFTGDTNTGIFSPAADTVAIAAGGSNKAQFGTGSAIIDGLTVGRGAGAVATNTAVGASALAANTTGNNNTAVGQTALTTNTTGNFNTAVGRQTLYANTSGTDNSGFGLNALVSNTTGSYNTAIGRDSLQANTTASNNTAVGYQAGYANTTGASGTFIGRYAGLGNTTGSENTAVGNFSLPANTTGQYNVALGSQALASNTTASSNTAVGYQAGYSNTTGPENTFIGYQAGYYHTTSGYNTFVGAYAGQSVTTGTENQFFGRYAGQAMTTGSKNTIIGKYSGNQGGLDIRTLSDRIVISDGNGNPRIYVNDGGEAIVGGVTDQGAYNLQCNGTGVWGAGAYVNGSDERIKDDITPIDSGLDVITKLNPVTYKYKETWSKDQSTQTGFIAQELLTALDGKIYVDGVVQQNSEYMSVAYQNIIPILVKAMQELKQEFDAYKATHP